MSAPSTASTGLMPLFGEAVGADALSNKSQGVVINAAKPDQVALLKGMLDRCNVTCDVPAYYAQCQYGRGSDSRPAPAPPGFLDKDPYPKMTTTLVSQGAVSLKDDHRCTIYMKGGDKYDTKKCYRDCLQWETHLMRMEQPDMFMTTGKNR